ncbi:MAG: hypothetical protein CK431_17000 [Mycobacterium sp.]|nr:MAG: hypothetical protein CK431_17000 [Mycobacterium sp.]
MLEKLTKIVAEAVAAAVAREVAKQLPDIAETVAGTVADRVMQKLPDLSDLGDLSGQLQSAANIGEQIVNEVLRRLPKLPPFFGG